MNVGLQDAAGLGWRLADVLLGLAPDGALDDYAAERQPVGRDLLLTTQAQSALRQFTPDGIALRTLFEHSIATIPALSLALARKLSGLDVGYPADGHHLAGTRAPICP